jgi:hypothetical protein
MYPTDSVQNIVSSWWEEDDKTRLKRGSLVYAFVPHVDQVPNTLTPIGRKDPTQHNEAIVRISPLRIKESRSKPGLPVAALSLYEGELWTVYRAKKRPCLVLDAEQPEVKNMIRRGMPKILTSPTVLVAPYYGADKDGNRSGYNSELVERVQHAEYPQFFWDKLPIRGARESILRFDHIQPVGLHHYAYEHSGYALSDDAVDLIIDDWLIWLFRGELPPESIILDYQEEIRSIFPR